MASPAARKRLGKEFQAMQKSPPPFAWGTPDEKNILNWHFILRGPPDSPYEGGEYYGMIMFPSDYPFKPPDIKMITPSGRFQTDKKICTSMTSFHPSTWNPAWSVATILTGLLSFMLSDENTTGSMTSTEGEKKVLAGRSHGWNLTQKKFRDMFPDYAHPEMKDVPDMGVPPAPSAPGSNAAPSSVGSSAASRSSASSSSPSQTQSSSSSSTAAASQLPIPPSSSSSSSTPISIESIVENSLNQPPFKRSALSSIPSSPSTSSSSHNPLGLMRNQDTVIKGGLRKWMSWGKWIAVGFVALVLGRLGSLISQG